MQQINIVISGFTPYEGIDVNPAVLVPAAVAKQWADPAQSQAISEELLQDIAVTVTNVTLPVSFAKAWPTLLEAIEQAKPDIVIATGLKRTSRGILLERCATNLMDAAKPDADTSYFVGQKKYPINYDLKAIGNYVALALVLYIVSVYLPIQNIFLLLGVRTLLLLLFVAYIVKTDFPLQQIPVINRYIKK